MNCRDYREMIAAQIDGELSAEEQAEVTSHVADCLNCHRLLAWESRATSALKAKMPSMQPPWGAKERLLQRLEEQNRGSRLAKWFSFSPRLVGSVALLVLGMFGLFHFRSGSDNDFLSDAVARYRTVVAGGPGASRRAGEPLPAARRLDLTPLGYELADAQTDHVRGRQRRLSVFLKAGDEMVIAHEIDGAAIAPSVKGRRLRLQGREFVSATQAGVNLVAWQDEGLLCVLTSIMPNEKLLQLARQITNPISNN